MARAEAVLSRECAARVPNVDVQAGVQYDNATRDTIAGVQAGVPLPVFNRNQGNIRQAEAELAVGPGRSPPRRAWSCSSGWPPPSSSIKTPAAKWRNTPPRSCPTPRRRWIW